MLRGIHCLPQASERSHGRVMIWGFSLPCLAWAKEEYLLKNDLKCRKENEQWVFWQHVLCFLFLGIIQWFTNRATYVASVHAFHYVNIVRYDILTFILCFCVVLVTGIEWLASQSLAVISSSWEKAVPCKLEVFTPLRSFPQNPSDGRLKVSP